MKLPTFSRGKAASPAEQTSLPGPLSSSHTSSISEIEKEKEIKDGVETTPIKELEALDKLSEEPEYPTGAKLGIIIASLCLSVFLMALDNTIIATAIPKITNHFKSLDDVGWYGSGMQ